MSQTEVRIPAQGVCFHCGDRGRWHWNRQESCRLCSRCPGWKDVCDHEVDRLAALIREVDGNHDLGADALAEALVAKGVVSR